MPKLLTHRYKDMNKNQMCKNELIPMSLSFRNDLFWSYSITYIAHNLLKEIAKRFGIKN